MKSFKEECKLLLAYSFMSVVNSDTYILHILKNFGNPTVYDSH